METGLNKEVSFNYGRDVLVVSDVLCEDNECNRDISHCNSRYVRTAELAEGAESLEEGEVGYRNKGFDSHSVSNECSEAAEVDNFESVVSGLDADDGEDSRDSVAGEDADDERDELDHLLAEDGAEHCHEESDETADDSDIDACGRLAVDCIGAFLEVADSVACERKSDYSNGGSDNGGGHELIDPADTGNLDRYCYNNIDETREHSAENQSEIAERNGGRACESGCHRAEESERRTEENRALCLREENIYKGACAGAEERRDSAHLHFAAVINTRSYHGNCDGRCHNRKQLLERKDDKLAELRLVFDTVNQFHTIDLLKFCLSILNTVPVNRFCVKVLFAVY